jgi:hypothetical protein
MRRAVAQRPPQAVRGRPTSVDPDVRPVGGRRAR